MRNLSTKELMEALANNSEMIELIDVREISEYTEVRLKEAKNIPLSILPLRISEVAKDKKVVFICRSGGRSGQAITYAE
jgi:rhodanese-related sulfurtransferase